ncbi:hypothetical protein VKT23_011344 [Stygiomarasmius scandens]|uniref:Uncharacterized protein n=1 Tax=Marasmiellus scandens TaxID=2682957 RepID=A0ABR1JA14_9AGAR
MAPGRKASSQTKSAQITPGRTQSETHRTQQQSPDVEPEDELSSGAIFAQSRQLRSSAGLEGLNSKRKLPPSSHHSTASAQKKKKKQVQNTKGTDTSKGSSSSNPHNNQDTSCFAGRLPSTTGPSSKTIKLWV